MVCINEMGPVGGAGGRRAAINNLTDLFIQTRERSSGPFFVLTFWDPGRNALGRDQDNAALEI